MVPVVDDAGFECKMFVKLKKWCLYLQYQELCCLLCALIIFLDNPHEHVNSFFF